MSKNYKHLWDKLISSLCREIVKLNNLPEKAKSTEDEWVEGTLVNVLRQMMALHKLPPKMQKDKLTRPLFDE